jgi:ubiquinone/menaquinone biosynthesis C-methylase UbiE
MTESPLDANRRRVERYYDRTESRLGYSFLLSGSKHYGWYDSGDSMWGFRAAMARMEDELAKRLSLPSGARVLDAGCGTGAVARALAKRHGFRVDGIDILDWNLQEAERKATALGLDGLLSFKLGDYHNLDFPGDHFDGAYTMETLVHAADSDQVLDEFLRVLKPGGHLVLFEYSHVGRNAMPSEAWEALVKVCDLAAMPAWLEFEDGVLDRKLASAGFEQVKTEDVTEKMMPMLKAFNTLGVFPYWLGRRIDKVEKTVNAMSGVEMYRHRGAWKYNITVARKPL